MPEQYLQNWALLIGACFYGIKLLMKKEYKTEHIRQLYQQALSSKFSKKQFQKPEEIVVLDIPTSNVSEDMLQIFRREQNKGYINPKFQYPVSGGAFKFNYKNKNNISCDINDCVVSKNVLDYQIKNISLFGITPPQYQSFKAHLKKFTKVTMLGTMGYNIDRGQFVFYPSFIAKNIAEIIQYYQQQQFSDKFLILCMSLTAVASIIYKTPAVLSLLKKAWRKITGAPNEAVEPQYQEISADPAHRLKCYYCESRLADIVLECGHLVQCQVCHSSAKQRNQDIICWACRKRSNKVLKLYIA